MRSSQPIRLALDASALPCARHALLVMLLAAAGWLCACSGDDDAGADGNAGSGSNAGTGGSGGGGHAGRAGNDDGGTSTGGSGSGGTGHAGNGGGGNGGGGNGGGGSGGSGSGGMDDDAGQSGSGGTAGGGGSSDWATACSMPETSANPGNECPSGNPVALKATLVRDGLNVPIMVTHAGDDPRLFVAQRDGRITILDPETGADVSTFLDLSATIWTSSDPSDERGLLGLAFHPSYPDDPRFYVNYTAIPGSQLTTYIVQYEVSDDPDVADPNSAEPIYDFDQPQGNHNGGMVAFGPDGCLYVGAGDGGNSNDQGSGHPAEGNGQNLDTPLAKILRFDVDEPTAAAPGNLGGAGIPHIWDYGMRNPWRFSFDRATGDLYIGDVGQDAYEEVDVEPKGAGQKNYGWKIMEGQHCRPGGDANCDMDGLTLPVSEYMHQDNDNCIIGGYVYRGSAIPSLQGWYLYADNGNSQRIRALVWNGEGTCGSPIVLGEATGSDGLQVDARITSFGEDAAGEMYITTLSSVYRIDAE